MQYLIWIQCFNPLFSHQNTFTSAMKNILLSLFCILFAHSGHTQTKITPYESSEKLESAPYHEVISWYKSLSDEYDQITISEYGRSDIGEPIHLVVISKDGTITPNDDRVFMLINNGIHPGEPCGVDASMMLARDLMQNPELNELLDHVVIGIIPIYNIGGSLNRSCCTRANQVGPTSQGFRGNASNLDLNRDFMKMDAHNTHAFASIFQEYLPDIFLDTHTTNGADYQAPITYISTLSDKLEAPVAEYLEDTFVPQLLEKADDTGLLLIPYVNKFDGPPEEGMAAFLDLPRYASGYAGLFQTMGFISEAHMLKSFETRVEATYDFTLLLLELANQHSREIKEAVTSARETAAQKNKIDVAWTLDTLRQDSVMFFGYESEYRPGKVTGAPRLYYDPTKPYSAYIPYFRRYNPTLTVEVPNAYIIPQAWTAVLDRLEWNGVEMYALESDTTLEVEMYYVETEAPGANPYEGHYYHQEVTTRLETQMVSFKAGDIVVETKQIRKPFLVHALEPAAQDSWFRWNFFDAIMMQKEYFSPYLFENLAATILEEDAELTEAFEQKKEAEPAFASNPNWQLFFIYTHSPYYEVTHKRYPVARWKGGKLLAEE